MGGEGHSWSQPDLTPGGSCTPPLRLFPHKRARNKSRGQNVPALAGQSSALILDSQPGFWFQPAMARSY